jgi:hypothetical protein
MKTLTPSLVCLSTAFALVVIAPACGSQPSNYGFANGDDAGTSTHPSGGSSGSTATGGSSGSTVGLGGNVGTDSGTSTPVTTEDGGVACPTGLKCNVVCPSNGTTSITGKVYDPALKDPLYNVAVYVPATPLVALPRGVPTGAEACSCSALFQSGALTNTTTDETGSFTLNNVPVGSQVPLVIQIGKWRRLYQLNVTACQNNAQPDTSIAFLGTIPAGDTNDNMPDIAVSTGGADSLECLMVRVGIPGSEYVAGGATTGHVHIFNGGTTGGILGLGGGQETNLMPGAPLSSASLWDSTADLMNNDIVLLSCEGSETSNALPQNLEDYLNAGGRAFASHYHYAWFTGSTINGYSAPTDWGNNLAEWSTGTLGGGSGVSSATVGGTIVTTLTSGGGTFYKGTFLDTWLANVGALGQSGVPAAEVAVAEPRFNANVTTQAPSQSWIQLDPSTDTGGGSSDSSYPTLYFSFDTPVNAPAVAPDSGASQYCGRAVFSGLHVGGASYDGVNCSTGGAGGGGGGGGGGNAQGCNTGHVAAAPPPTGCDTTHGLSPQEKVLEFMLFDLSSCVIPDTVPPPVDAGLPPPQPPPK